MGKPLQIDGLVEIEDNRNRENSDRDSRRDLQRLEDENRTLRRDLEDALHDKERLERTIRGLQTTLGPLHRILGALFGEMDLAVGEEIAVSTAGVGAASNGGDPRWESYKAQFPGMPAKVIDALLVQGEMSLSTLAKFLGANYYRTRNAVNKLKGAGAIAGGTKGMSLKR